jgi:type II secretion system (T2SS) protein M
MTTRDRMVLIAVVVLVLLAGGWVLVVSPERNKAGAEQAQVQSARQQLETAKSQANSARAAEQRYNAAYSSVVSLGKAVPASEEVPSLIYQLELASDQRDIEFTSITTGNSSGSGSSSASASAAAATSATPSAFTPMPFTFVFKGSFAGLAHLLGGIDGFAQRNTAGQLTVSGRLLTIQGADITVQNGGGSGEAGGSGSSGALTATITATAYVLPASQGLTGGATAAGPSTTTTSSSSSTTPTTAAVVKATP